MRLIAFCAQTAASCSRCAYKWAIHLPIALMVSAPRGVARELRLIREARSVAVRGRLLNRAETVAAEAARAAAVGSGAARLAPSASLCPPRADAAEGPSRAASVVLSSSGRGP